MLPEAINTTQYGTCKEWALVRRAHELMGHILVALVRRAQGLMGHANHAGPAPKPVSAPCFLPHLAQREDRTATRAGKRKIVDSAYDAEPGKNSRERVGLAEDVAEDRKINFASHQPNPGHVQSDKGYNRCQKYNSVLPNGNRHCSDHLCSVLHSVNNRMVHEHGYVKLKEDKVKEKAPACALWNCE